MAILVGTSASYVQTLSDIQIALKVIGGGDKGENPIDHHYRGLNCTLTPVDHEDVVFELVEKNA